MTQAERLLWDRVRGGQILGLRFRRQQVIHGFIVDFYYHAARLVIEVDGDAHTGQGDYDAARGEVLTTLGLRVLRIPNDAVLTRLADMLADITACCEQARPHPCAVSLAAADMFGYTDGICQS